MFQFIINIAKKIKPLGFAGLSVYDVTIFFWKGLVEGAITTRASSLAFNFFLAFFPSIIVFFTLIPYIPIAGLQETLIELLSVVLPPSTNEITFNTLDDIINNPRGGLLSIGFILALYFSANGMSSLIEAFNSSYHINEYRSLLRQKALSITLTFFLALLLIITIGLIIFGKVAVNYLTDFEIISKFSADLNTIWKMVCNARYVIFRYFNLISFWACYYTKMEILYSRFYPSYFRNYCYLNRF